MIILRHFTTILGLVFVLTFTCPVSAGRIIDTSYTGEQYEPTAEDMILDGLIYRPLAIAGTVIGTGIFIVTLPFSILGGNVDEAGNRLVIEPAKFSFGSCLGCIHDYTIPSSEDSP
jgi:hypothetical protein